MLKIKIILHIHFHIFHIYFNIINKSFSSSWTTHELIYTFNSTWVSYITFFVKSEIFFTIENQDSFPVNSKELFMIQEMLKMIKLSKILSFWRHSKICTVRLPQRALILHVKYQIYFTDKFWYVTAIYIII
jgi:hypothetical protein